MSFFSRILEAVKDAFNLPINPELSEFQKRKLLHEFRLFYGKLTFFVTSGLFTDNLLCLL